MKNSIWYISLLVFTFSSCNYFVLKKDKKEELVKEKLDKFNWDEVEQPPLFVPCENSIEEELELCFQNTITKHFHQFLSDQPIKVKNRINDTVWIPVLITKNSQILLKDFEIPDRIESEIPNLKDLLETAINSLPKVAPAHKRGTPVTALYKLPLVIRID
ncbi:hypothetical protein [Aquimarina aggregata]|uniref:hypothetical protein n=1 Tax=Aquimarina aggregata TaxID=1642818 RepID=UPI0024900669|nr:hypothetical protein [Aquimarina aggregata]